MTHTRSRLTRLSLSDRRQAIALGRTVARVDIELPAGFEALPRTQRSNIFREELANAADAYDLALERSA